jgi:hypothetical protein
MKIRIALSFSLFSHSRCPPFIVYGAMVNDTSPTATVKARIWRTIRFVLQWPHHDGAQTPLSQ